ncbi:hypothetical protein LOH54_07170 [Sulfurimonas sp. HSL-3221]|nr:hypothetical protein [Sulfurimonas sp. HSL-3221]UFS61441.1 hypothetical protein LOH54_07170 [Sulfurimonas sp. HSL-3221]
MGPPNLPPDSAGHLNTAALPGFMVWAGVIICLVAFAWYLERQRNDDE